MCRFQLTCRSGPFPTARRQRPWRSARARGSAILLCRRAVRSWRCGRACAPAFRSWAWRRTAVAGHAAPPPGCTDNCCRTRPSTSSLASHFCVCRRGSLQAEGSEHGVHARARIHEPAAFGRSQVLGPDRGRLPGGPVDAFGQDDGFEPVDGFFEAVVNQNIIVLTIILNLFAGGEQPPLDNFLRNYVFRLTPALKAFL